MKKEYLIVFIAMLCLVGCGISFIGRNNIKVNTSTGIVECSFDIILESGKVIKSKDFCQFEAMKEGKLYQCLFSLDYLENVSVIDITKECVLIL